MDSIFQGYRRCSGNPKHEIPACGRQAKLETKMSNPKLKTLNSKQTQLSKALNPKQNAEKPKLLFDFYILDLLRI
jgi:hypothetical protein